jgi:zinc and cadmium transporter
MSPLIYSLLSTLVVSSISLIGLILIFVKVKNLQKITLFLVSFAVGGLLGDAFIHLIPQSFEFFKDKSTASIFILIGILIFFVMEKILRWHHCHEINCHQEEKHVITLNLVGDSVHNYIDGALIAASFQISTFVGLTTTLAVILHEIPQEIGDFGIFIHHGVSVKKTIFYNFISGLTSLLGVFTIFLFNYDFSSYIIPFTAGGFIYLALTDLTPELHRHDPKISIALTQLFSIILGLSLMFCLLFLE